MSNYIMRWLMCVILKTIHGLFGIGSKLVFLGYFLHNLHYDTPRFDANGKKKRDFDI